MSHQEHFFPRVYAYCFYFSKIPCNNFLLLLFIYLQFVGAAIFGVSIWILVDPNIRDYLDIAINANGNDVIDAALYILCAIGAFTFIVGLMGCCGACQESSCMLCTVSKIESKKL